METDGRVIHPMKNYSMVRDRCQWTYCIVKVYVFGMVPVAVDNAVA